MAKWRAKLPRIKERLKILLRCKEHPALPEATDEEEVSMPEFAENADEAPSYEKTKEFEVFVLQRVAPLVEGSTLSKEALLEQVRAKMASLEIPESIRNLVYEPEELLNACFTMQ